MNRISSKRKNRARQARLAAIIQYPNILGPTPGGQFKTLLTTYSKRKQNNFFSNPHIPYPDRPPWTGRWPTDLLHPKGGKRQTQKFEELVEILFNKKGVWDRQRIEKSKQLITEGARIGMWWSNPYTNSYRGYNMKIWENLKGHCIADKWQPRKYAVSLLSGSDGGAWRRWRRVWAQSLHRDGYRCGLMLHYTEASPSGADNVIWDIPPNAPPIKAYKKFLKAQAAFHAIGGDQAALADRGDMVALAERAQFADPQVSTYHGAAEALVAAIEKRGNIDEGHTTRWLEVRRQEAREKIVDAWEAVKKQIGWDMPGGDLLVMLVKKKIPIEIITCLLDYGMTTDVRPRCFNNHENALNATENIIMRTRPVSPLMIQGPNQQIPDYFDMGWSVNKWPETGTIHFIIRQYIRQCTTIFGKEYYQELLKLIFLRNFRKGEGPNRPMGRDEEDEAIIDSPEYQAAYKTVFPRLTAIAQTTIKEYDEIKERVRRARDAPPAWVADVVAVQPDVHMAQPDVHIPQPDVHMHNGGRRRSRKRKRRRKRRRKTRKKGRKKLTRRNNI